MWYNFNRNEQHTPDSGQSKREKIMDEMTEVEEQRATLKYIRGKEEKYKLAAIRKMRESIQAEIDGSPEDAIRLKNDSLAASRYAEKLIKDRKDTILRLVDASYANPPGALPK